MSSTPSTSATVGMVQACLASGEAAKARDLATQALSTSPADPAVLSARADAHAKLGDWLSAADDARRAVEADPGAVGAWVQRGTALFNLDEFEAAAAAFARVLALDPSNADAATWARKCAAELEAEGGGAGGSGQPSPAALPPPPPRPPSPPSYPVQWFQTADKVEVAVLAKRLTPDRVRVGIEAGRLAVEVLPAAGEGGGRPGGPPPPPRFSLTLALAAPVDPAKSSWELLSTKVEIRLVKATPCVTWPALDADGDWPAPGLVAVGGAGAPPPRAAAAAAAAAPSAAPSSAKVKRDWNALEKAVVAEEKVAPPEGEAALTHLFQTLYADADDDTRRAMVKSYQESGGTVLSTNWAEVGAGKVDMTAPEGMEVRKYEY